MAECEQVITLAELTQADGPLQATLQALAPIFRTSHLSYVKCLWLTEDGNCVGLILNKLSRERLVGSVEFYSKIGGILRRVREETFILQLQDSSGLISAGREIQSMIEVWQKLSSTGDSATEI